MNNRETIIIDCQILQTKAFDRGMGKYVSSLLKALSSDELFNKNYESIYLILNSNLNITDSRINHIKSLIPKAIIVKQSLPVDIDKGNILEKEKLCRNTLSEFVDSLKTQKASFVITAPFFVGFASMFPEQGFVKKICLVYDFIPYRIWKKQKIFPDELYFRHFQLFFEADHLLTISQFVKSDLSEVFKVSPNKIASIDGGPFKQEKSNNKTNILPFKKYFVYPSAPIVHKNNEVAVMGFDMFNSRHNNQYRLVFTSSFDEDTKNKLTKLSNKLYFTGNVSDSDLANIYENTNAVLFASLSEGLGMPVLEAMQYNKPIACSDIPVLTEISNKAIFAFKPNSPKSIAESLEKTLNKTTFDSKSSLYNKVLSKYSWQKSAQKMMEQISKGKVQGKSKYKVVVCSPDTSLDRKTNRVLEKIYAQLCEAYRIHTINSSSNNKLVAENPSFTKYIREIEDKEVPVAVLKIGSAKVPAELKGLPVITIKRKSVMKKSNKLIEFKARRVVVDKYLGFKDWDYEFNGSENIVKDVKERLKTI